MSRPKQPTATHFHVKALVYRGSSQRYHVHGLLLVCSISWPGAVLSTQHGRKSPSWHDSPAQCDLAACQDYVAKLSVSPPHSSLSPAAELDDGTHITLLLIVLI
jgi:hypothetical protein